MNNNIFYYFIIGILYCAVPAICAAVTIASNSPAEVPADNFRPSLNYSTMRGVYRLMAYGSNRSGPDSDINGTITVTITTTDGGSQTVTMPICPLGMTECYAADEYFADISPVDSPWVSSPTNPVIQSVSSVGKIINTGTNTAWGFIYLRYKTENPNDSNAQSTMGVVDYSVSAQGRCAMDVNDTIVIPPLAAGQRADPLVVTSNPEGSGYLTFKPDTYDTNGGILKGEKGNTLSYSIVGSYWNAADGQWRSDLTKDYSVQLGEVPATTQPGGYQGTIIVTISCA